MNYNIPLQYACLHCHSTHSDGINSPRELALIAKDEGYSALSITDHDTYTANSEAEEVCREIGIEYIHGIEFSTHIRTGEWLHLTAFDIDPTYPRMKEYLRLLSDRETDETEQLFKRAKKLGLISGIEWEEVLEFNTGITWICNEHVFRAMKAKGLITDKDYPAFFANCFGKHRGEVEHICEFMTVDELIPLVHSAGGLAVHAHPLRQFHLLPMLVEFGLDGIEVWHAELSARERYTSLSLAREYDLYVSGGCDHDGLLGGQYARYENPESCSFYYPPRSLGTSKFFYEEIRDMKKGAERVKIIDELLADETIWIAVK